MNSAPLYLFSLGDNNLYSHLAAYLSSSLRDCKTNMQLKKKKQAVIFVRSTLAFSGHTQKL